MGEILTSHQIPGAIIDIIEESQEFCFLVTPYFKPWKLLYRALEKAAKKDKKIIFIFRADNDYEIPAEMYNLNEDYGFDVIFVERLHTKLYMNEKTVLISSMNLHDSSKENNYELGYILRGEDYAKDFFTKIIEDILSLEPVGYFQGRYFESIEEKEQENGRWEDEIGYCIRCKTRIYFNPRYPLCNDCYEVWSYYSNPYYTEEYCHMCGRKAQTSKDKPLCYDCYNKLY